MEEMQAAQQFAFTLARKTLMKGIQDGDTKSAIEYLKRRDGRYRDKQEIETTHKTPERIEIEIVK